MNFLVSQSIILCTTLWFFLERKIQAFLVTLLFADISFFDKLKVCDNPELSKSTGTIFPTVFACFCVFASHYGNSLISQTFIYYYSICFGDLWSEITDIIVIVLGCHKPCPCKTTNLINIVCSDYSTNQLVPHLTRSPWASLFSEI